MFAACHRVVGLLIQISMLGCTLNPAVRNDTLSVNEEEVMALLGFTILTASSPNLSTSGLGTPSSFTILLLLM